MQHASPEVSEVATLLITAAALIVDFSIRRDQTQDRIVLAVLLWLTCSLQTNPPQLSILVQCIFFGIIVAALSCSPIVLWKISLFSCTRRKSEPSISSASSCSKYLVDAAQCAVPAAWVSLFAQTLLIDDTEASEQSNSNNSIYFFIAVPGILCFVCFFVYKQQKHKRKHVMHQEIPTFANSNFYHGSQENCHPDPQLWYQWTPSQFLQWILVRKKDASATNTGISMDQNGTNGEDSDVASDATTEIAATLACQRIRGSHLDRLTVADFRSMGLAFGQAIELMDDVNRLLIQKHPRPQRQYHNSQYTASALSNSSNYDSSNTGWLAQHDREYNGLQNGLATSQNGIATRRGNIPKNYDETDRENKRVMDLVFGEAGIGQQSNQSEGADAATNGEEDYNFNIGQPEERAKQFMRNRFGLELPEIWKESPCETLPLSPSVLPSVSHVGDSKVQSTNFVPNNSDNELLSRIFADMPPHISEICNRKPELVEKILKSYHQQQQQQQPGDKNNETFTPSLLLYPQKSQEHQHADQLSQNVRIPPQNPLRNMSSENACKQHAASGLSQPNRNVLEINKDGRGNADLLAVSEESNEEDLDDTWSDEHSDGDGERTQLLKIPSKKAVWYKSTH